MIWLTCWLAEQNVAIFAIVEIFLRITPTHKNKLRSFWNMNFFCIDCLDLPIGINGLIDKNRRIHTLLLIGKSIDG